MPYQILAVTNGSKVLDFSGNVTRLRMVEGAIQVWYNKLVSPLRRAKCQSRGTPFRGRKEFGQILLKPRISAVCKLGPLLLQCCWLVRCCFISVPFVGSPLIWVVSPLSVPGSLPPSIIPCSKGIARSGGPMAESGDPFGAKWATTLKRVTA